MGRAGFISPGEGVLLYCILLDDLYSHNISVLSLITSTLG